MSVNITKPNNPAIGSSWYDPATGELKTFIGGQWVKVDSILNESADFVIKEDGVEIYSMTWWLNNAKEVGEWLADDNGYVDGGLNTGAGPIAKIKLKNKGDASYFKLKWG